MNVIYATGAINKFLEGLEENVLSQTLKLLDTLSERGHTLRLPHSRALGSHLFELRLTGSHPVRLLYCFHKGHTYILHAIIKKQGKLRAPDIAHARTIHKMVLVTI